ncbi:MAG TPA: VWA domain-containing protein [Acidisarcina sp.]
MLLRRVSSIALLGLLPVASGYPQTAVPDSQTGIPTFQLRARTVVIDVVVTDSSGQPVPGLHKQDFTVRDSGQPQTISYFEEHSGVLTTSDTPAPTRQDNVFTNVASAKVTDSVNVLLLDSLNTPIEDQSFVHNETMKYLKSAEPGTRMAIFTLGNELRFVQGFTADVGVLAAALNKQPSRPQSSALLPTQASRAGEGEQLDQMKQMLAQSDTGHGADPTMAASIAALQQFQAQTHVFETDQRRRQTLFALQQLGRYLAGIPGRKNVIWFSGAFPINIFPDASGFNTVDSFTSEVRETDALLAGAQVAIYPIAAEGVASDQYNSAEHHLTGVWGANDAREDQSQSLQQEASLRNAAHTTMDQIAHDTGGEAFYNTNGIKNAVARVVHNGSRYYTIAYTPTNAEMNGAFRPLVVTLNNGNKYHLNYRRGYFAVNAKKEETAEKIADPLHPYMGHGMPDSTEIPYTLNLVPSPTQPAAGAPHAGDNAALKGPTTRYTATIWMPVTSLQLTTTPDGLHQDSIEAALVIYDQTGKALNWMVRNVNLSLKPERYAAARQVGIPLRVEIDAPAGEIYLRTGIYEQSSHTAGTLEVPLSEVVPGVVASR